MRAMRWRDTTTVISHRALLLNVLVLTLLVGAAQAEISRTSGLIAEGTKWENPYYIVDSGVEGPTLLITGGLHGNEPAGYRAAEQIRHWPVRRGKLIVVPQVNTPGLKQNTRWLPSESKELRNANRNFPKSGEPNKARSVPINTLWEFVQEQQPDWVVDLHEGYDFNIANSKSDGSSIIYFNTPEMQQLAAKIHNDVNATIDDPDRKIVKRSKSGPVDGGLVRAAVEQLGARGLLLRDHVPEATDIDSHATAADHGASSDARTGNGRRGWRPCNGVHDRGCDPSRYLRRGGTGGSGVEKLTRILDQAPASVSASDFMVHHVGPADIQTGVLDQFDVVIFPGGSGSKEAAAIGEAGCKAVQEFVESGGGYVGICAGAFLATAKYDWSLALVNANTFTGNRKIPGVGVKSMWFRGSGKAKMELTDEGREILGDLPGLVEVGYANGPILSPAGKEDLPEYIPLAFFRTEISKYEPQEGTMIDTPAIVASVFGKGRAIAISPHPEGTAGLESLVRRAVAWVAAKPDRVGDAARPNMTVQTAPSSG